MSASCKNGGADALSVEATLVFADGEMIVVSPRDGKTVLEAAESVGIALAHDCRDGRCKTCAARDMTGKETLLCQFRPDSDVTLRVPYARADLFEPVNRRAKILALEKRSQSVWWMRLRLQFEMPFLPGQYISIAIPDANAQRNFSMANAPVSKEFDFYIRELPDGAMSRYLADSAKVGDILNVVGPYGRFFLRNGAGAKLFMAGGTGLAPILSMLRALADRGHGGPVFLGFGVTSAQDLFGVSDLTPLNEQLDLTVGIAVMTGLVEVQVPVKAVAGTVLDAVATIWDRPATAEDEAYICGPPRMVDAARAWLRSQEFDDTTIFNEEFLPAEA